MNYVSCTITGKLCENQLPFQLGSSVKLINCDKYDCLSLKSYCLDFGHANRSREFQFHPVGVRVVLSNAKVHWVCAANHNAQGFVVLAVAVLIRVVDVDVLDIVVFVDCVAIRVLSFFPRCCLHSVEEVDLDTVHTFSNYGVRIKVSSQVCAKSIIINVETLSPPLSVSRLSGFAEYMQIYGLVLEVTSCLYIFHLSNILERNDVTLS
jgi:hypothetical protein